MIKAVIFDKDGLMFDTERWQYQSFVDALAKYGHKYEEKHRRLHVGRSAKFVYSSVQKIFGIKDIEKFIQKRRQRYRQLSAKNLQIMPGLLKLLKFLKERHFKLAVASGSHLKAINQELKQVGIKDFFDVIASSEKIPGKPEPDLFLTVAKKLKVKPSECLVLEDAQPGVEAAKKACMSCIAIPSKFTKHQDFSKADLVIENLRKVISVILEK